MPKHLELDAVFMLECLTLAQKGRGFVSPNPLVGAVLTRNNHVIGRGYHKKFGGPHAEVNLIHSTSSSPKGATLYVNVEPCNFFGKTPPCTDLIISSGITRVVVGMKDPNPKVGGRGIRDLRESGITVDAGVLEHECMKLNEAFTKHVTTGLPFVTLKIAQTLDGKIADKQGNSKWITNAASRKVVHHLRASYDAVLVGAGTVAQDNPRLTVRDVPGRNPMRVVLDGRFTIDPRSRVALPSGIRTLLFSSVDHLRKNTKKKDLLIKNGLEIIELPGRADGSLSLGKVLYALGSRGVASLLVEGGAKTFSAFLHERAVDKVITFIAPKIIGEGLNAFPHLTNLLLHNSVKLSRCPVMELDGDLLVEAYLHK